MSTTKEKNVFTKFEPLLNRLRLLKKNKSFTFGLPFLVFVVGGSFGLREWTNIRYDFSQVKSVSREEAEKMGLKKDKKVTIEDTYEEIQTLDIDNWENKRGPRPWEENITPNPKK